MGLINAVLPIGLAVVASLSLPTGFASILFAPTPLFAALVARAWLKDQLTARQLAGLVIGIFGVAVLVGLEPLPMNATTVIGIAAALTSCMLYAVATSFVRKFLGGQTPLQITTGQTMGSALVMLPFTLVNLPDHAPGLPSIAVLILFGSISTAIGFLMVFQLLGRIGPTNTQTIALLIPCFGVIWGALFRAEPVYASTIAGLVIVLISVSMVTGLDRAVLDRIKPARQPG
jgi:drug/metabolite transporter (DMT)-like permease